MTPAGDPSDQEAFARFGAHLRGVRRQLQLSLQDVEVASNDEFKASVVGAYERGDRAISVHRLQRLARLYRVPVAAMLPGDKGAAPDASDRPLTIDLVALRGLHGPEAALLGRYLRGIEVQRGDFNGRVLTVRRNDAVALASILDCPVEELRERLDSYGCLRPQLRGAPSPRLSRRAPERVGSTPPRRKPG
jgi:transcriptional regulator with XRE-family HTH domain